LIPAKTLLIVELFGAGSLGRTGGDTCKIDAPFLLCFLFSQVGHCSNQNFLTAARMAGAAMICWGRTHELGKGPRLLVSSASRRHNVRIYANPVLRTHRVIIRVGRLLAFVDAGRTGKVLPAW
jgi:hypothetical protein